jgi:pimeloyl-ACP methyl ester carboxylesterase
MNAGLVFIHGAGLGSFIWTDLKSRLNHPSLAINFPNRGKASKKTQYLSFDDYCERTINQVKKWNMDHLIIVGHSIGGSVGLRVAEYFGEKVIGFAGIGAIIPEGGNSALSCHPLFQRVMMQARMRIAGTRPPRSAIEKTLCNDLDDRRTSIIVKRFTPESRCLYTDKTYARIPPTQRLYIRLSIDQANPPAMQDRMIENLMAHKVATIRSGHLPMMSHPTELAKVLNEFSNEVERDWVKMHPSAA